MSSLSTLCHCNNALPKHKLPLPEAPFDFALDKKNITTFISEATIRPDYSSNVFLLISVHA